MKPIQCLACEEEVIPRIETREETYKVRGEAITVEARVGVCPRCAEDISIEELDDATLVACFDEYRKRHHLMLPSEMRALRARYGLGVRAFSLLLGWGELSLHRYEKGSLQDDAHETQLRMATSAENVRIMLAKNGHKLTARQRAAVEARLAEEAGAAGGACGRDVETFLVREDQDEYGGWRGQELSKLREMAIYFSALPGVYPTKLNKLLFYADFGHFKEHSTSISGTPYLAFQHGPVPAHYDRLLADLYEGGELEKEEVDFPDGSGGERLRATRDADISLFSAEEIGTLRHVAEALGSLWGRELRERSHSEKAWTETPPKAMISYEWARELSL